eukprot:CAMPEP_0184861372 /NCGR_PEP_ID=MMETSP0580-20130426/6073_1 /TAXON_ID=1118495 /ORGANISM="Dactyliosolen fragilissimus" /LENGTH=588 /DNA_ID=CAMNT_0027358845 /DNA_START=528 /DNA_END=2294 /DNA_ORIENTATION=+
MPHFMLVSSSSSISTSSYEEELISENLQFLDSIGPVDALLHASEFWSCTVMFTVIFLLLCWEKSVQILRSSLPATLASVVDGMLAEMGGLGFIGLVLSIFVTGGNENTKNGIVAILARDTSERFLGEDGILIETLEFLHTLFFEVGIAFFLVSGITVLAVLKQIGGITSISNSSRTILMHQKKSNNTTHLTKDNNVNDDHHPYDNCDDKVSLEQIADRINAVSLLVDVNGDGIISAQEKQNALVQILSNTGTSTSVWDLIKREVNMSKIDVTSEAMVVRERMLTQNQLSDSFLIENYFERVFAQNLEEMVELSPITWIPLVPLITLDNSLDLQHEVVSAASSNAIDTCGLFVTTPWVLLPSIVLQLIGIVWGSYNFWKISIVKNMLMPTLVRNKYNNSPPSDNIVSEDQSLGYGSPILLPPPYEVYQLRQKFDSSPGIIGFIEEKLLNGIPGKDHHQRLFGKIGAMGPSFLLKSIKFYLWSCVAQLVFYSTQILSRDLSAILNGNVSHAGNPDTVLTELYVYGFFVAIAMAQIYFIPRTFLNYSLITSIEMMIDQKEFRKALKKSEDILRDEEDDSVRFELLRRDVDV